MMSLGRYDSALQMFVDEPREPNLRRLAFLRWLIQNGRLEHPLTRPVTGEHIGVPIEDAIVKLPLAS
jgi:hypothetical protein